MYIPEPDVPGHPAGTVFGIAIGLLCVATLGIATIGVLRLDLQLLTVAAILTAMLVKKFRSFARQS